MTDSNVSKIPVGNELEASQVEARPEGRCARPTKSSASPNP
jgi:hypothetical protein